MQRAVVVVNHDKAKQNKQANGQESAFVARVINPYYEKKHEPQHQDPKLAWRRHITNRREKIYNFPYLQLFHRQPEIYDFRGRLLLPRIVLHN